MRPIYAEEIIKAQRSVEDVRESRETVCRVEQDTSKGYIIVRYEQLALKKTEIMDGKAVMLLPENMEKMSEERMAVKYPDPDRPNWILSNSSGTVAITFHLETGELQSGEAEQITELLKGEMRRLYPASEVEEEPVLGEGRERVYWFSLDIPLIDDQCCHVMFFREMEEGLLMGTFDCSQDTKKQWKPILSQLLPTIREGKQADEYTDSIQPL